MARTRNHCVQQELSPVKEESETEILDVPDSEDESEAELEEISQDSTPTSDTEDDDGHEESPWKWRKCSRFLSRLACVTEQGKPVPFKNTIQRDLPVDEDFTISGFHDGEEHRPRTPSMVLVNDTVVLSLDPAVVGTVLNIPWKGQPIPGSGNRYLRMRLAKFVAPETQFTKDGAVIETLGPELRQYIDVQRTMLFLPGKASLIPLSQLLVLAQSLFHKEVFNWAEHRTKYVVRRLATDKARLPEPARELLSHYIRFAIKALEGFKPGAGKAAAAAAAPVRGASAAKGGNGTGVHPARDVSARTRSRTRKDVIDSKPAVEGGGRVYATRARARTGGFSPAASEMSTDEDVREQKRNVKRPAAAAPGGSHSSHEQEEFEVRQKINSKRRDSTVTVDEEEDKAEQDEVQQHLEIMHRENRRLRKILAAREREIAAREREIAARKREITARKTEIATLEALVPVLSYLHVKRAVQRQV